MLPLLPCYQRSRRVAVRRGVLLTGQRHSRAGVTRAGKGLKACIKSAWRRQDTGSNHISAFGVWRDNARRTVARINRIGETRWHRLPVAARAISFFREMP